MVWFESGVLLHFAINGLGLALYLVRALLRDWPRRDPFRLGICPRDCGSGVHEDEADERTGTRSSLRAAAIAEKPSIHCGRGNHARAWHRGQYGCVQRDECGSVAVLTRARSPTSLLCADRERRGWATICLQHRKWKHIIL